MSLVLGPNDPPPFIQVGLARTGPFFVTVEHAGQAIPASLGDLGLPPEERARHIAYDPGAEAVGTKLAELLDAPLHKSTYSRLVVDLNRDPAHGEFAAAESDGTRVPANANLSANALEARLEVLFRPYHAALRQAIEARPRPPILVFMHTMTNRLRTQPDLERPWPITVLHNADMRIAAPLLDTIRADGIETVGNQPYSGYDHRNYSMNRQALAHGLAHTAIELRQDLLGDAASQQLWAERLAGWLNYAARHAQLID